MDEVERRKKAHSIHVSSPYTYKHHLHVCVPTGMEIDRNIHMHATQKSKIPPYVPQGKIIHYSKLIKKNNHKTPCELVSVCL